MTTKAETAEYIAGQIEQVEKMVEALIEQARSSAEQVKMLVSQNKVYRKENEDLQRELAQAHLYIEELKNG